MRIDAPPEKIQRLIELRQRKAALAASRSESVVAKYHDDPAGFVTDCIRWKPGQAPTAYQLRNLSLLVEHRRLAVRGPHGLGKTTSNAWAEDVIAAKRVGREWAQNRARRRTPTETGAPAPARRRVPADKGAQLPQGVKSRLPTGPAPRGRRVSARVA